MPGAFVSASKNSVWEAAVAATIRALSRWVRPRRIAFAACSAAARLKPRRSWKTLSNIPEGCLTKLLNSRGQLYRREIRRAGKIWCGLPVIKNDLIGGISHPSDSLPHSLRPRSGGLMCCEAAKNVHMWSPRVVSSASYLEFARAFDEIVPSRIVDSIEKFARIERLHRGAILRWVV